MSATCWHLYSVINPTEEVGFPEWCFPANISAERTGFISGLAEAIEDTKIMGSAARPFYGVEE